MNEIIKLKKVVDCNSLPNEISRAFFDYCADWMNPGNDCYVDWWIEEDAEHESKKIVDDYLISLGLEDGEDIIIRHWW